MNKVEFTKEELKMILNLVKSYIENMPYEFVHTDNNFGNSVEQLLDKVSKYVLLQGKIEIMIENRRKKWHL